MSKLSEELAEELGGSFSFENAKVVADALTGRTPSIPGFKEMSELSKGGIAALLRSAKLHFAGAAPWESGKDALEATSQHMNNEVLASQLKIMCCGIRIAHLDLSDDVDYREVLKDQTFRFIVDVETLRFGTDREAMEVIAEHVATTLASVSETMDFTHVTGKETCHVWDVWWGALGSNALSMYLTGFHLGCKWRDEEILNGIVQATDSEVSND